MNIARICNCVEFPETIVDPDLIKHGEKKRYVPEQRLYLAASAPFSGLCKTRWKESNNN